MKRIFPKSRGFIGLLFQFLPLWAFGANSAVLTFTAPTQNTDGSAITLPLTYNVWQGACGAETLKVSGITVLTYTADPATLLPGTTVCWKVTATAGGGTSAFSSEVSKSFPALTPKAPGLSVL